MSEHLSTGIGRMEAAAAADIALLTAERSAEARANSAEISALNDIAQLEVFGSSTHTYTSPETGEVIASPDKPMLGKIDEIRKNPRYGKTQAERDDVAEMYGMEIDHLVNENNFELCQAKMIMDMREEDGKTIATLTGEFIHDGLDPVAANEKAAKLIEKKDEKRLSLIKEGGAYTPAEYDRVRKGLPAMEVEPAATVDAKVGLTEEQNEARRKFQEFEPLVQLAAEKGDTAGYADGVNELFRMIKEDLGLSDERTTDADGNENIDSEQDMLRKYLYAKYSDIWDKVNTKGDEKDGEPTTKSRVKRLRDRIGLIRRGDLKNGLGREHKDRTPEEERRRRNTRRVLGAAALVGGAYVAWKVGTGDIDINPFDNDNVSGVGGHTIDLNPVNGDHGQVPQWALGNESGYQTLQDTHDLGMNQIYGWFDHGERNADFIEGWLQRKANNPNVADNVLYQQYIEDLKNLKK